MLLQQPLKLSEFPLQSACALHRVPSAIRDVIHVTESLILCSGCPLSLAARYFRQSPPLI